MTMLSDAMKDKLKQIPELPGIYKMLDSGRNIIYIGKSICLKKRVKSYFTGSPKWEKVNRMVSLIKDIEYVVTDTHLEARLLECELIKFHQPYFNAQMKNDKRYIFIKVEPYNQFRPLSVVANRESDSFGPFRSKYSMSEFLDMIKNIYPITRRKDGYEFEYHLFPITMDRETFENNRSILLELFTEEAGILHFINVLQDKLENAASLYRYEIASKYRDMIQGFLRIKNGLDGYKSLSSKDLLLKLPSQKGYKLFFISGGNIIYSRIASALTDHIRHDFLQESKMKLATYLPSQKDEKASIDFRDIMYSEISNLSDEMIEVL
jgi:excinuclease ABC subunit C